MIGTWMTRCQMRRLRAALEEVGQGGGRRERNQSTGLEGLVNCGKGKKGPELSAASFLVPISCLLSLTDTEPPQVYRRWVASASGIALEQGAPLSAIDCVHNEGPHEAITNFRMYCKGQTIHHLVKQKGDLHFPNLALVFFS